MDIVGGLVLKYLPFGRFSTRTFRFCFDSPIVCNISLHLVKLPTFSFQSIISNLWYSDDLVFLLQQQQGCIIWWHKIVFCSFCLCALFPFQIQCLLSQALDFVSMPSYWSTSIVPFVAQIYNLSQRLHQAVTKNTSCHKGRNTNNTGCSSRAPSPPLVLFWESARGEFE